MRVLAHNVKELAKEYYSFYLYKLISSVFYYTIFYDSHRFKNRFSGCK